MSPVFCINSWKRQTSLLRLCFRLANQQAVFTAYSVLAIVLALALCPSAHAEEVATLPNHLHVASTGCTNNNFGRLYDLCILWRSNSEIIVRAPGPQNALWTLTKEELPEYLETKSPKSRLLVTMIVASPSYYRSFSAMEKCLQLEPIATFCKTLGYKRVVVAGSFRPKGTFGPDSIYDTDDDDVNVAETKTAMY